MKLSSEQFSSLLTLFIGLFAIFALRSIFDNDSSNIVSKEGRKILSDSSKMKEINAKIIAAEKSNQKEVLI